MTLIFYCTQKTLKELDLDPKNVEAITNPSDQDLKFYVNVFRLGRIKCTLFTHADTLLSFMARRVPKKIFQDLHGVLGCVLDHTEQTNFDVHRLRVLLDSAKTVKISKTVDNKILGSMVDMKKILDYYTGGSGPEDIDCFNQALGMINKTPYSAIDNNIPIEAIKSFLQARQH